MSPLRFSVMTRGRSNGRCPFCHRPHGSKEHVLWNCPARFQVPDNLVESELGWPLSRNQTQVVQDMAKVRAEVLRMGGGLDHLGRFSKGRGAVWRSCCAAVKVYETTSCAETDEEAADLMFAYRENFWKRASDNQPGLDDRVASLLSSYPCQEACLWEFPTGVQLSAVARAGKGSAGPDGWSGDELRHMPVHVFEVFATLAGRWLRAGVAPNQMLESRMVCLPKPGKVRASDNTVSVEHTRPITVLSCWCWWRLFARWG